MARGPYAAIAAAIVAVSTASILIRWSDSDAITIAFYRLGFATLIILPFAAVDRATPLRRLARRDAFLMAGIGVVLAAHFALWITSLKTAGVTVASSVVLVTSHPVMVALVSHFLLKERVSGMTAAGIALGFTGVVGIAVADLGVSTTTLGGDLAALGGGVMAGIYFLAGRRLRQRVSLPVYAFVVYGTAALALFVLAMGTGRLAPVGDLRRELLLFGAMAIVPQIGGHTLYNWSLRFVTAPVVSVSLVGEPIGSTLLAWALLGEVPSNLVAIGALLALAGIFLTAYSTGTAPSKTSP
jgi:drug/metabolite transporter (DMT)-like permease